MKELFRKHISSKLESWFGFQIYSQSKTSSQSGFKNIRGTMAPGSQQDSTSDDQSTSDNECSVLKVIESPASHQRQNQPSSSSFNRSSSSTSSRRMLAMKKEALKTEAEQIDQILIDAGIDPHNFKDFNERKVEWGSQY